MKVPDEIRKSIVYIMYENSSGEEKLAGTGFFALGGSPRICCLVTAKHVIEGIKRYSADDHVYIRANTQDGGTEKVRTLASQWFSPDDDPTIDVALLYWDLFQEDGLDYLVQDLSYSVTDQVIEKEGVGIGDKVIISGLFHQHYGTDRNIPIIRIGNLVAMREEPVRTGMGLMDAYLIECRSFGGLSGSPVTVHNVKGETVNGRVELTHKLYFLGLIHGHWDTMESAFDEVPNPDVVG